MKLIKNLFQKSYNKENINKFTLKRIALDASWIELKVIANHLFLLGNCLRDLRFLNGVYSKWNSEFGSKPSGD